MLLKILSSPNQSSKKWIFSQYDSSVMGDTVASSEKADAAIVRVHGTNKAIAITSDCNPIYCKADPKLGSKIAVARVMEKFSFLRCNSSSNNRQSKFWKPRKT